MPKFKVLLILLLPLFFATSCEEEWDLTDDQQVIEALLYQPVTSYNIVGDDYVYTQHLEPNVRALWVHTDSTHSHFDCMQDRLKYDSDRFFILDLKTLRSELKVSADRTVTYNGMEVFAVEDVYDGDLALQNQIAVKLSSAEHMSKLWHIANKFNCRIDTPFYSFDALLTTPLGTKAANVSTYIENNLPIKRIEIMCLIRYRIQ